MKKNLIIGLALLAAMPAMGQVFTETLTRELVFEKKSASNTIMIFNINGEVKVEGYTGDKVLVEARKRISAKTDARMELGKEEIQLGVMDRADTLILYIRGRQDFGKQERRRNWRRKYNGWGYEWNDHGNRDNDAKYDFTMHFTIKVPSGINVLASTINNGDIEIQSVNGSVLADNVNGSIRLNNISGTTNASTINGSLNLDYSGNPPGDSRFYSLNGDINANFRKGLTAQLTFKSFNGDFYSSIDDISPMAVVVEKYEKGDGIRYKVNGNRYKVRQGGPLLDFETFNGDVYLKEK